MAGLTEREREIRTKRAELWEGMKPAVEKAGKGEALTAEERTAYHERDAGWSHWTGVAVNPDQERERGQRDLRRLSSAATAKRLAGRRRTAPSRTTCATAPRACAETVRF
jgi:hypothetical protein